MSPGFMLPFSVSSSPDMVSTLVGMSLIDRLVLVAVTTTSSSCSFLSYERLRCHSVRTCGRPANSETRRDRGGRPFLSGYAGQG